MVDNDSIDPLLAWRALGSAFPQLVREAESDLTSAWRTQLEAHLRAGGFSDSELITVMTKPTPNPLDPDFRFSAQCGAFGERIQSVVEQLALTLELQSCWQVANEEIEDDLAEEPWAAFWQSLAESRPEMPRAALETLGQLFDEATDSLADPASIWPLQATGETEAQVLGLALDQLSARVGIPRADLPPVPLALDKPVLIFTQAAASVSEVNRWVEERAVWSRLLGRLAPLLPHSGPG